MVSDDFVIKKLKLEGYTLYIFNEVGEELPASLLKKVIALEGNILREKPNTLMRINIEKENFFVKRFMRKKPLSFVFSPFRKSASLRSALTASFMIKNGLLTPHPVVAMENRKWGFVRDDIFICEWIKDVVPARDLVMKGDQKLVKDIAIYVKALHDAGIYHRDLNLENFLITPDRKIYLVDLNRARFRKMGVLRRAFDIMRIDLHGFEETFLQVYSERMRWSKLFIRFTLLLIPLRNTLRKIRIAILKVFSRQK